MKSTFELLFETLQSNYEAVETINERIYTAKTSNYYTMFNRLQEQKEEIQNLEALKARVLNLRHKILENIQLASQKELQFLSAEQRKSLKNKLHAA